MMGGRWRRLFGRSAAEDAINDEIREHLDQRTADLVRQGVNPVEARRRARVEFGPVEAYREASREEGRTRVGHWLTFLEQLAREWWVALRRLRATPVFTVFAVVSLALALGVTTAIYSTVGSLVWHPSPIDDPEHLAVITRESSGPRTFWLNVLSAPDVEDLRRQMRSVPALAATSYVQSTLSDSAQTSPFAVEAVTGNYFSMTGFGVHLGRSIQPADDEAMAGAVVVLSYEFWRSKAGANPGIVGQTVRIAGKPFVVVGVGGEEAQRVRDQYGWSIFVYGDGWIPLVDRPLVTGVRTTGRDESTLGVIARLPPNVSAASVATEVRGIGAALDRTSPIVREGYSKSDARPWSVTTVAALAREQEMDFAKTGGAVALLVMLVLAVACTNIANLTLGRGTSRRHEFAVRRALGASRARLVREQCAESVLLAAAGALGAFLVARALLGAFAVDLPIQRLQVFSLRPTFNAPALVAAAGSLMISLVVFGLIPALQLTRTSLREGMAGEATGASPGRWKGRRHLIMWQVAISTALILLGAEVTKIVTADSRHDTGLALDHLVVGRVNLRPMHWDVARTQQAIGALDVVARTEPGFELMALTTHLPLGFSQGLVAAASVSTIEQPSASRMAAVVSATPTIFRTLGVPILRGRGFDDQDAAATTPLVVVSERTATTVFGTSDVVGRQIRCDCLPEATPQIGEVIGVARDTDVLQVSERKFGAIYVSLAQQLSIETRGVEKAREAAALDPGKPTEKLPEPSVQALFVVGRTAGDPTPMVHALAGSVRRADPDLAVEGAATGPVAMASPQIILRMAAIFTGGLSILAVSLAMLGLYGVLSHVVARRTREMGLRLALGAGIGDVRQMVLGEGLSPVIWGLGLGTIAGALLRALYTWQRVSWVDPVAFTVATVTLLAAGLLASYLPARRASSVDPNVALRDL